MLGHYLLTAHTALTLTEGDLAVLTLAPMDPAVTAIELSSHWEADAWLAAEHATIRTLAQVAAEAGMTEIAWQLAWMVSGFLLRRGCWADHEQMLQACLDAAQRAGDTAGEAHALLGLGLGYLRSGRIDDAEAAYLRAGGRWRRPTAHRPAPRSCTPAWRRSPSTGSDTATASASPSTPARWPSRPGTGHCRR